MAVPARPRYHHHQRERVTYSLPKVRREEHRAPTCVRKSAGLCPTTRRVGWGRRPGPSMMVMLALTVVRKKTPPEPAVLDVQWLRPSQPRPAHPRSHNHPHLTPAPSHPCRGWATPSRRPDAGHPPPRLCAQACAGGHYGPLWRGQTMYIHQGEQRHGMLRRQVRSAVKPNGSCMAEALKAGATRQGTRPQRQAQWRGTAATNAQAVPRACRCGGSSMQRRAAPSQGAGGTRAPPRPPLHPECGRHSPRSTLLSPVMATRSRASRPLAAQGSSAVPRGP